MKKMWILLCLVSLLAIFVVGCNCNAEVKPNATTAPTTATTPSTVPTTVPTTAPSPEPSAETSPSGSENP